jgi:hypothetical protein
MNRLCVFLFLLISGVSIAGPLNSTYPIGFPETSYNAPRPDFDLWSKHMSSAPKARTKNKCRLLGGSWEKGGKAQDVWGCIVPTPDAGKVCTDDTQCSLLCLPDENSRWGLQSSGVCIDKFELNGCIGGMQEGLPTGRMCFD